MKKLFQILLLVFVPLSIWGQPFSTLPQKTPKKGQSYKVAIGDFNNKGAKMDYDEMVDSVSIQLYPNVVSGLVDVNNAIDFRRQFVREASGRLSYVDYLGKRITIDNGLTINDINTKIGNVVYAVSDDSEIATATQDTTINHTSTVGGVGQFASSSTFSGWSSEVGTPTDFKIFKFTVNAFDNALIPSKLRVRLYATGNVIYDDSITVSLTLNVPKLITITLAKAVKGNTSPLFIDVSSNGRLSLQGNGSPNFTATQLGKYATNASIINPIWYAITGSVGASTIKVEFSKVVSTGINFLQLAETDMANKLGFLKNSPDSLKVGTSFSWLYESSTFSGWGWSSKVIPTKFNGLQLNVRGFDNADLPTQMTVRIRKNTSTGLVVAQKTVPFTPINEKITILFGQSYTMTDTAWIEYICDGKIGLYGESTGNMGRIHKYTTSQNLADSVQTAVISYPAYRGYSVFINDNAGWRLGDLSQYSVTSYDTVKIYLPKIRATVGKTTQIFFRGIIAAVDLSGYNIKITGNVGGSQYPRYYEFTPTTTGNKTFTITLSNNLGNVVATATTTITVKAAVQNPSSAKKIMPIGDSLTDGGTWTGEAIRLLSGTGGSPVGKGYTNVQFIGTKGSGTNKYEGYGGKTWEWYSTATTLSDLDFYVTHNKTSADLTSIWVDGNSRQWRLEAVVDASTLRFSRVSHAFNPPASGTLTHVSGATNTSNISYSSVSSGGVVNPFWNTGTSQLDFANYISTNGFGTIDGAVILLGWNQSFSPTTTVTAAKVLIDKLHTQYPSCKIKVVGLQLPSLNGGLGNNYLDDVNWSNAYEVSKRVWALNRAYENMCNESGYSGFCEYIDIAAVFDSENNGLETVKAVNLRNSKTEYIGTNGVHPATSGYYQIADAVFNYLISEFCQ